MGDQGSKVDLGVLRRELAEAGLIQRWWSTVEIIFSTPDGEVVVLVREPHGSLLLHHVGCQTTAGYGKGIRPMPSTVGIVTAPYPETQAFLVCRNPACDFKLTVWCSELVNKLADPST